MSGDNAYTVWSLLVLHVGQVQMLVLNKLVTENFWIKKQVQAVTEFYYNSRWGVITLVQQSCKGKILWYSNQLHLNEEKLFEAEISV